MSLLGFPGPEDSGGLTSKVMETGSRMERAVSSSLERLQENSSRPSTEQLKIFSWSGIERKVRIKVPCNITHHL